MAPRYTSSWFQWTPGSPSQRRKLSADEFAEGSKVLITSLVLITLLLLLVLGLFLAVNFYVRRRQRLSQGKQSNLSHGRASPIGYGGTDQTLEPTKKTPEIAQASQPMALDELFKYMKTLPPSTILPEGEEEPAKLNDADWLRALETWSSGKQNVRYSEGGGMRRADTVFTSHGSRRHVMVIGGPPPPIIRSDTW